MASMTMKNPWRRRAWAASRIARAAAASRSASASSSDCRAARLAKSIQTSATSLAPQRVTTCGPVRVFVGDELGHEVAGQRSHQLASL